MPEAWYNDVELVAVIEAIPKQTQRQYDTTNQLRMLIIAANRLGLYDAADRLKSLVK